MQNTALGTWEKTKYVKLKFFILENIRASLRTNEKSIVFMEHKLRIYLNILKLQVKIKNFLHLKYKGN